MSSAALLLSLYVPCQGKEGRLSLPSLANKGRRFCERQERGMHR